MEDFKTYWKEKAQKRRKSWSSRSKKFAEQHTKLENIREQVFLPFEYVGGFDYNNFTKPHHAKRNPFAVWQQGVFSFSEDSLREAMIAQGADISQFKMEVCRLSIVGKEVPQPEVTDYYEKNVAPSYVYDIRNKYRAWLKRIYEICTDVQICKLTYGQVSMVIRRYSQKGFPFAYYELIPCEQLVKSAILMEETSFNQVNIATLLMEMAAEYELREEEMSYHAKKQKLRKMDAVTIEGIDLKLWDDKKLEEKVKEYVKNGKSLYDIFNIVVRPWKSAVKKYIEVVTERECPETEGKKPLIVYSRFSGSIRNYLDSQGIKDVKVFSDEFEITIEYQGFTAHYLLYNSTFYPNSHNFPKESFKISDETTLSAIAEFVKVMPEINQRAEEIVVKMMRLYDQLIQKDEQYRKNVEILEPLATKYAGTLVGKLVKCLRWEAGRLTSEKIPLSSIKFLNDKSFSYLEKDVHDYVEQPDGEWQYTKIGDVTYERWLNSEFVNLYRADPETTDAKEWEETHTTTWGHRESLDCCKVESFIRNLLKEKYYCPYITSLLSADFFDKKL